MSYSTRLPEAGAGVNCAQSCLIDQKARVAKLADAPDLGSGGEILRGSSPLPGTSIAEANALYVEIADTGRAVAAGESGWIKH